ncbi:hypothetical protein [Candidatus Lucifugimonas marina]|uniref:Uncharacterized protein n=1 Tax=Candidatus Lucifugimonas marina TaxID=3038979 RepID=A0AAJ6CU06_9CHLR|nr:hypothetical protein [SAR202 cluster bacterium JH639]WFG38105.1 hypothetical protein GKO48_00240 [SAR202 cluster bacterium JH1073]
MVPPLRREEGVGSACYFVAPWQLSLVSTVAIAERRDLGRLAVAAAGFAVVVEGVVRCWGYVAEPECLRRGPST